MNLLDNAEKWLDDKLLLIKKTIMNILIVNDDEYKVRGNRIKVRDDKILVNGDVIVSGLSGDVRIEFEGDVADLDCSAVTINGNVLGGVDGTTITVKGDVHGDVDGTVINCGDVGGDVDGTNVRCRDIRGVIL